VPLGAGREPHQRRARAGRGGPPCHVTGRGLRRHGEGVRFVEDLVIHDARVIDGTGQPWSR
jgi:hypothetical protein